MCGIVGYVGFRRSIKILFSGLKRLEYRGYDSSGICVINSSGTALQTYKSVGKISDLQKKIENIKVAGNVGISHTRWATHGKPSDENSHPHIDCSEQFAVVHNGIIENYAELKKELIKENHIFKSETDTEVLIHLIEKNYKTSLVDAVRTALELVTGSYAVCVISLKEPDKIICARSGSPLVIGKGEKENFVASDMLAILPYTKDIIFLDDRELAVVTPVYIEVMDFKGNKQNKAVTNINWDAMTAEKKGFKHYMLKEIFEQPDVITETIEDKYDDSTGEIKFRYCKIDDNYLKKIKKIYIVACGTAWHAGLIGKYYLEEFCGICVEAAIASEFRYRNVPVSKDDLILIISQSGETADSLAALRNAKEKGALSLGICNVRGSALSRECDGIIYTNAGPEIGVASTKAFTTQLTVLFMFSMYMAKIKNIISEKEYKTNLKELSVIPSKIKEALDKFDYYKELSLKFHNYSDFLFLGRHYNFPIALEGALKLKEISYIHAEGYAAGEMKHGPIALITEQMPVLTIATKSFITDKVISNLQEVKARDGITIVVTNESVDIPEKLVDHKIFLPDTIEALAPIVNVIPLQVIAYQIADFLGCDIDQPRNLAKSVTVE
ncbi:glutamine--fructose-6-phosphate transaminase (isomerizing) [Candidatus Dependentiae bacterium]|nr:glutamine--fructose-6-phosphate transaminase (isomerizing) [Candidatus Dependentiae bacterium]